jgi:hypothetical protein
MEPQQTNIDFISDLDPIIIEKSGNKLYDLFNFDIPIDIRINVLNELYNELGSHLIEIIKKFTGMYQYSEINSMKIFLEKICTSSILDIFLKYECIKSLLYISIPTTNNYNMFESDSESESESESDNEHRLSEWRAKIQSALEILSTIDLADLPTLCKLEAIYFMMEITPLDLAQEIVIKALTPIILDKKLPSDYKFKILHSLESRKKILIDPGTDIEILSQIIKHLFSEFINCKTETSYYRCLGIQYLVANKNKLDLQDADLVYAENILLEFANDISLDYNRRADAADLLSKIGTDQNKNTAKTILINLGNVNGVAKTVFENAQNVHLKSIETSVESSVKYILSTHTKNNLCFKQIKKNIKNIYKQQNGYNKNKCMCNWCGKCENEIKSECLARVTTYTNIKHTLSRIYFDKLQHTDLKITLQTIFVKIFSIILEHENKEDLVLRMFQEFEDMVDTCSSGYISRLVNILSGYVDTIKISWEEQISANLNGRLNYCMRNICTNPIYLKNKLKIISIYIDRKKYKFWTLEKLTEIKKVGGNVKVSDILASSILNEEIDIPTPDETLDLFYNRCLLSFSKHVLLEISEKSTCPYDRKNFLVFLGDTIPSIRTEMYNEFSNYISDSDFDIWFKNSICKYDDR